MGFHFKRGYFVGSVTTTVATSPRKRPPESEVKGRRNLQPFHSLLMFGFLIAAVWLSWSPHSVGVGVALYTLLAIPYLITKLALAALYRPSRAIPVDGKVAVVIPIYEEDAELLSLSLASVLAQTRKLDEIWVIDDGSSSTECFHRAASMLKSVPGAVVHRFNHNQGKRKAQAWAIARSRSDFFVTLDSDSVLDVNAINEGLRPFQDDDVMGVCGIVRVLNSKENLLTRLIHLRFVNGFLYERAAYSVLGSNLCNSGALSFYRTPLIQNALSDYVGQTFLGKSVNFGDDRRLTLYALQRGRVVFQSSAIVQTKVPAKFRVWCKQQVRWNKSFIRESLLLIKDLESNRVGKWLGLLEFSYWCLLTTLLAWNVMYLPLIRGSFPATKYLAFVVVMSYARSVRVIGDGGKLLQPDFLLAPIYGLLNLIVLVPIRLYAATRLADSSWGTRISSM